MDLLSRMAFAVGSNLTSATIVNYSLSPWRNRPPKAAKNYLGDLVQSVNEPLKDFRRECVWPATWPIAEGKPRNLLVGKPLEGPLA